MKSRGFTLIELLVVIAIIGLLAGIVLVSLGGARDKAKDARVNADFGQIKVLAELVYDDASPNSYAGLCNATFTLETTTGNYATQLLTLESDINDQNGAGAVAPICWDSAAEYCVSAVNASGGTVCINNTGETGTATCSTIAATDCTP